MCIVMTGILKFACWTSTTLALKFPVGHTGWDIVVVPCQFCHCLDVAVHGQGIEEEEKAKI